MFQIPFLARRTKILKGQIHTVHSQGREATRIYLLFTPKARRLRNAFAADSTFFLSYLEFFIKSLLLPSVSFDQ